MTIPTVTDKSAHKFLLTTQQYHLMHEAGIFKEDDRLELINREIKIMLPIGRKHTDCVTHLQELFIIRLLGRVPV